MTESVRRINDVSIVVPKLISTEKLNGFFLGSEFPFKMLLPLSAGSRVATVVMSLTQVSAMKYCDGAAARLHSVLASDWSADSDPGL